MKSKMVAGLCMGMVLVSAGWSLGADAVKAQDDGWTFEVIPYGWLLNIDADVAVHGQEVSIDKKFSDMIDSVDLAGSLFLRAAKGPLHFWAEGDYFSLNEDAQSPVGTATLDVDSSFLAGGVGYQLPAFHESVCLAVFAGARYLKLDNALKVEGLAEVEDCSGVTDPLVGVRAVFTLSDSWRVNLPISIGAGGDSDFVCDVQPNVAYQFNETVSAVAGARWLYYDYEGDTTEFQGSFNGMMLGVGFSL
jgi:hypothetical protein